MKSYLRLNNEVLHHYNRTGKLDLAKDKEAARRYFLEHVNVKMRYFIDLEKKSAISLKRATTRKNFWNSTTWHLSKSYSNGHTATITVFRPS